jgi:hypothetical protein
MPHCETRHGIKRGLVDRSQMPFICGLFGLHARVNIILAKVGRLELVRQLGNVSVKLCAC